MTGYGAEVAPLVDHSNFRDLSVHHVVLLSLLIQAMAFLHDAVHQGHCPLRDSDWVLVENILIPAFAGWLPQSCSFPFVSKDQYLRIPYYFTWMCSHLHEIIFFLNHCPVDISSDYWEQTYFGANVGQHFEWMKLLLWHWSPTAERLCPPCHNGHWWVIANTSLALESEQRGTWCNWEHAVRRNGPVATPAHVQDSVTRS